MHYFLAAVGAAFLIAVPYMNEFIFKTPNLEEIRRQAAEKLDIIKRLQLSGDTRGAKDSCKTAILHFKKNKDDLSKFIVETIYFRLAFTYKGEFNWNSAIDCSESGFRRTASITANIRCPPSSTGIGRMFRIARLIERRPRM